jgi:hypothetical protein
MMQKISAILPSDKLTCIKFLKKDISRSDWIEKNEFEYNGSMYDVVKKEETSQYYFFYCLDDKNEEILIKNYNKNFDDNKDKPAQNNPRTLLSQLTPAILKNNLSLKRVDKISFFSHYLILSYISICIDKLTPPPKKTA